MIPCFAMIVNHIANIHCNSAICRKNAQTVQFFAWTFKEGRELGEMKKESFWFWWNENISTLIPLLIIFIVSCWEKDVNNIQSVNLFFVNMAQNSKVKEGDFLGKTETKRNIIFSRFCFLWINSLTLRRQI